MVPDFVWLPAIVRWIHILAAVTWVGGTIFVVVVLTPLMRGEFERRERVRLFSVIGRRFNVVGWIALLILLLSGVYNSLYRLRELDALFSTTYGTVLLIKLGLVAAVVFLTWLHASRMAPRLEEMASREVEPGEATLRLQRRLISLSPVHLLLNLIIVFIAALLSFI